MVRKDIALRRRVHIQPQTSLQNNDPAFRIRRSEDRTLPYLLLKPADLYA
jgi:hypothetical protein